jgi:hypothetical protein
LKKSLTERGLLPGSSWLFFSSLLLLSFFFLVVFLKFSLVLW